MRAVPVVLIAGFVWSIMACWGASSPTKVGEAVAHDVAATQRGGTDFACATIAPFTCQNIPNTNCVTQSVYHYFEGGESWKSISGPDGNYCGSNDGNCYDYPNALTTRCSGG